MSQRLHMNKLHAVQHNWVHYRTEFAHSRHRPSQCLSIEHKLLRHKLPHATKAGFLLCTVAISRNTLIVIHCLCYLNRNSIYGDYFSYFSWIYIYRTCSEQWDRSSTNKLQVTSILTPCHPLFIFFLSLPDVRVSAGSSKSTELGAPCKT